MDLLKEYMNRKSIDIPVIHHVENGFLFEQLNNGEKIIVHSFKRKRRMYKPYYYIYNTLVPIKSLNDDLQFSFNSEKQLKWDEYEDFLLNLHITTNLVLKPDFVKVYAWKLMFYGCDKYISENINVLDKNVFNSLNDQLVIGERISLQNNLIQNCSIIEHLWNYNILHLIKNYLYWIEKFK